MLYKVNHRLAESPPPTKTSTPKLILRIALFAVPAVLFIVLAIGALGNKPLPGDVAILHTIRDYSFPQLDRFMIAITDTGSAGYVIPLMLVAVVALLYLKKRYQALFLLACVGASSVLNVICKHIFQRDRPELWKHLVTELNFSFPSGHSMVTATLALSVIVLLWNTRFRIPAIIIGSLYALFVGLSRLYLGVHYPTDVMGGWCLSILVVASVYYIFQYGMRRFPQVRALLT